MKGLKVNYMIKRAVAIGIFASLVVLLGCDIEEFSDSNRVKEDFHYTYDFKAGGRLSIDNFNGSIEITGWDQNKIDISGTKYASTQENLNILKIDIVNSPDSVQIRTVRPTDRRGSMGARYYIKLPRPAQLERIISSNGSIKVDSIEGFTRLRTSNGAVRASVVKGDLEARTTNGSIEAENVEGRVEFQTSNGAIRARDIRGSFEAGTTNGSIRAALAKPEPNRPVKLHTSNGSVELTMDAVAGNDITASTSNGGITLHLPSALDAELKASTSNSTVHSDFEVKVSGTASKNHLEGAIGKGGSRIDLSTSNGGIKVLKM